MKRVVIALAAFVLLLGTDRSVQGADAGDLIFPSDVDNHRARAELVYENRQRDLDVGGTLKLDAYYVRMHTDLGQNAYLDFDVGGIEPDGGDLEFYGGVGLRFLAYDSDTWRIGPFAQVHYTPSFKLESVDYDDALDADAGLLVTYKVALNDQLTLMPYAGPALSIIRLSGDVDADEDQTFGGVAGISLQMPGQNTFRVEAQYYDDVSISVAAGMVF